MVCGVGWTIAGRRLCTSIVLVEEVVPELHTWRLRRGREHFIFMQ
jgi:hypothetical protein